MSMQTEVARRLNGNGKDAIADVRRPISERRRKEYEAGMLQWQEREEEIEHFRHLLDDKQARINQLEADKTGLEGQINDLHSRMTTLQIERDRAVNYHVFLETKLNTVLATLEQPYHRERGNLPAAPQLETDGD